MKTVKIFHTLFIFFTLLALTACGTFGPRIPMNEIPPDAPDEVRTQIVELYSFSKTRRANGAKNLGNMGAKAKAAVPFLIDMLEDNTKLEDYRNWLKHIPSYVGSEAALALARIGDKEAVAPIFNAIRDENSIDTEFKTKALISMGETAIEPMSDFLSNEDENTRILAIKIISGIGGDKAVNELKYSLKDKVKIVKLWAVEGIRSIGGESAKRALSDALDETDHTVRLTIIKAIRSFSSSHDIELLIRALKDGHFTIRLYAAKELNYSGDVRTVLPLITALSDELFTVRLHSARALGNLKDKRAVEPLIKALDDSYLAMRDEAAISLGKIGDERAVVPILDRINYKGFLVSTSAPINALKHMNDKTTDLLLAVLKGNVYKAAESTILENENDEKDYNWHKRENAVKLLGKLDNFRAVEPLIAAINDDDKNVRINAIWALGAMKAVKAVDPIIALLKDEDNDIKLNSVQSLGKIGDKRAVAPLLELLDDTSDKIRYETEISLGKITGENFRDDKSEWEKWLKEH